MAYEDTPNKTIIRQQWDLPILERWAAKVNRPLSYFGLTGPEIKDLLDWKHLLQTRTAIESPGRTSKQRRQADETIGRMQTNIMIHNVSSHFQLLHADVEDVIINAVDKYGTLPLLNDGRPAHLTKFLYDIVNLDFDGGLGYHDGSGSAKRVEAIKRLFNRQQGHSFILFLTISLRHNLEDEIEGYLRGLQSKYYDPDWIDTLDWYLNRGKRELEYKLKAIVPSFILSASELCMFECLCLPPISYQGYQRARLMHFVFEFKSNHGNLRAFSRQNERDLINLPLIRCKDEQLQVETIAHPGFDLEICQKHLDALPVVIRERLNLVTINSTE